LLKHSKSLVNLSVHKSSQEHALKCELAGEVLRSSGTLRLCVTGWSMLPTIWPEDTVVIERIDSSEISEGDIVLFARDRRFFVHRVVEKTGVAKDSTILTRGDAMPQPDPPVSGRELMGRVSYIVRNGKLIVPDRSLPVPQRAIAALVRRSDIAARVVVGVHGVFQAPERQNPNDRAVPCQS
jgi:signal peptidase I